MLSIIRSSHPYQLTLDEIRNRRELPGLALPRAARLPMLACLYEDLGYPIVFITDRADHVLTVFDELGFWSKESHRMIFPEPSPLFYEIAAWGNSARRDRLQVLSLLASYHIPGATRPDKAPILICSARSLMTRTLPRRDFIKVSRPLKSGQTVMIEALLNSWLEMGYTPADTVLESGQISRRGGILDIWPAMEPFPARLDFFGDEIDTIRHFDPSTQRTIKTLERLLVTPAREIITSYAKGVEIPAELSEFYIPIAHPSPASLLDYLPQKALVVLDDVDLLRATVTEFEEQAVKLRYESIHEGILPEDFPVPYLSWSELEDSLNSHPVVSLGWSGVEEPSDLARSFTPGPRFGGRLKPLMDNLIERYQSGERVVIVSRQVGRLQELWEERHVDGSPAQVPPEFIEGSLTEGWIFHPDNHPTLTLLTDSEVFGYERPQPRTLQKPLVEAPESAYADLNPGDWVVHVDHGIGRYVGLVRRQLEGAEREFLAVEYEGGDQLFVPIHQADRLTRFIGPDHQTPLATRLGGAEWQQTKARVKAAVEEVAKELLDLYARRQMATGYAFPTDTAWQRELEASFPYIETQDQVRAITEVKADMERNRPMDRLLCGDVGYGKTEVALRAAFKAVMDGKQVAVLVPTTVLAQQHYDTFTQRLSPFPVSVEMLSRFRSPREQDEILKRLRLGGVDIVIGTHRLLQPDVEFKDLGLVIIDEEQRFGVTHKEYLKKLRTEVDVLTLTATPIPRTLYMALTGVRDISTINTPPEERLPIITHIGPYSPRLVRQAILRELERGGQVFFVHNRVQTIKGMYSHLEALVPEARIGIGHGQMPEHELSEVMHKFSHGDIDVLLCTSIIESGLDIPNANTLIVDRADAFGLAQLYQLRGRVGRGAQRAYSYFFRHKSRRPTAEGQERLEVIAENTQLGAGYSIAMRDLEMRGSGEILGTHQHGYIASVGFHLYTRLLTQAVRGQRLAQGMKETPEEKGYTFKEGYLPVTVDLPLSIGIPMAYVPDQNMRLRLYRRLVDLHSEDELDAIEAEFIDRFGPIPEDLQNLLYQLKVKLRAEAAGLASVGIESEQIVLRFPPLPEGMTTRRLPPIGAEARSGKNAYWLPYVTQLADWKQRLLDALSEIMATSPQPLLSRSSFN